MQYKKTKPIFGGFSPYDWPGDFCFNGVDKNNLAKKSFLILKLFELNFVDT